MACILSFCLKTSYTYFGVHIVTDQKVVENTFVIEEKIESLQKRCLEAIKIVKKRCDGKFMFLQYLYLDIHTKLNTQLRYNG